MAEADPKIPQYVSSRDDYELECHATRSRFIDAFAKMECAVSKFAATLGIEHNTTIPFGNLVKDLEKYLKNEKVNKKFQPIKNDILQINSLRNRIVHSRLKVIFGQNVDETHVIFFHIPDNNYEATVITLTEIKERLKHLHSLSNRINQLTENLTPADPAPTSAKPATTPSK